MPCPCLKEVENYIFSPPAPTSPHLSARKSLTRKRQKTTLYKFVFLFRGRVYSMVYIECVLSLYSTVYPTSPSLRQWAWKSLQYSVYWLCTVLHYTVYPPPPPPSANGPGRGDDDRWYKMVVIIVLPVILCSSAHENFIKRWKMENCYFLKRGEEKKYTFRCKV